MRHVASRKKFSRNDYKNYHEKRCNDRQDESPPKRIKMQTKLEDFVEHPEVESTIQFGGGDIYEQHPEVWKHLIFIDLR